MRQAADLAAVGVHDVNLQIATAAAAKSDLFAVRGPTGVVIGGHFARQATNILPLGVGDIDLLIAVARAHKGDLLSVRRPARRFLERFVGDDHLIVATIGVDRVDVQLAIRALQDVVDVNDSFAVGRPMAVEVGGVQIQKPLELRAVGVRCPQTHFAAMNAGEQEFLAVRRPGQMLFVIAVVSKAIGHLASPKKPCHSPPPLWPRRPADG